MKILITGSDGFIGKNLKDHFKNSDHEIFGITYFADPSKNEIRADIQDPCQLDKLPGQFDAIIHTAGIVDQTKPRKLMIKVNAQGTGNILRFAEKTNCPHFIQLSSIAVYGLKVMGQNRAESTTKRSRIRYIFPYGESKAIAEEYVQKSGLGHTILRLPAVIGKNDSYFSSALIPRLLNGSFYFFGKKDPLVSTIYIKNLCMVLSRILETGPLNDAFNCSDDAVKWSLLIKEYSKFLNIKIPEGEKSILSALLHFNDKEYMLMATYSYFGSHFPADKLKKALNWQSEYSWRDGINDACEGFIQKLNA